MNPLPTIAAALYLLTTSIVAAQDILWQIGSDNQSGSEFALFPDEYAQFIDKDFGWEDRYFLIGHSHSATDWPYILPGTSDAWGGSGPTAGRRSSVLNILFGIDSLVNHTNRKLRIDLCDAHSKDLPLLKVVVNGQSWLQVVPKFNRSKNVLKHPGKRPEWKLEMLLPEHLLKEGGNHISISIINGSWIKFDQIVLESADRLKSVQDATVFLRKVSAADYETEAGQPLLIDLEHLTGQPNIEVNVDGSTILTTNVGKGRYLLEANMPPVEREQMSSYEIYADGTLMERGSVVRSPQRIITPAGYVNTMMGSAHSRWMIAPGPWMPFSMVKLSPDNQRFSWQAGYDPTFESIGTFSHIHEWTMAGLGTFPANGKLQTKVGPPQKPDKGYRSRINKETEEAPLGYYKVDLTDSGIKAELTATTRCGFQRYSFPKNSTDSRVMIDFFIPSEYPYLISDICVRKVDDYTIEGYSKQNSPYTWGLVSQKYTIYFVMQFDHPITDFKTWKWTGTRNKDKVRKRLEFDFGAIAYFDTQEDTVVQVRTSISYVSIDNARENLLKEVIEPHGWSFESVRNANVAAWDELLGRIKISSSDRMEKMRFYTNMYRSLASRNIFSDVNGEWRDALQKVQRVDNPENPALGGDAFWNSFWNLNQLWNLITPEWSSRWVKSQLEMYKTNGWLAKGPAGMKYIPVMVAEHEIPFIVGAWQMGIRDFDVELSFEAIKKMQTTPAAKVGGGLAGNSDLIPYLKYRYVPYDKGRFSNTMEYAYDDWTVSQLAQSLGKTDDYKTFLERGYYWKNAIDTSVGYARMRDAKGRWKEDFDPFKTGKNEEYVEGNAWQLSFFVPQDVPALVELMGKDDFIKRLTWGFEESYKTRFNGKNDQYWDYPVVQGNQQSMHFAYLFNWAGQPWQTQQFSRAIMDRYYGFGLSNAYLGDEDQGQMSAWFVMAALGLFQTDGGCSTEPLYEIGSPLFEKVEINLGGRYGRGECFAIEARNTSRLNMYVQSATLNGMPLADFKFPASELLKGGSLVLEMGPEPNLDWGIGKP